MHGIHRFPSQRLPISMDFTTNIVDQSEQLPLDIYLGFHPQGKVVQAFLYAEIGKDPYRAKTSSDRNGTKKVANRPLLSPRMVFENGKLWGGS